jgi:hypothetical protein
MSKQGKHKDLVQVEEDPQNKGFSFIVGIIIIMAIMILFVILFNH